MIHFKPSIFHKTNSDKSSEMDRKGNVKFLFF